MFKNTLKQILTAAALCGLGVAASAQSGRLGGPVVKAVNVGYYNNSIRSLGAPIFDASMLFPRRQAAVTNQFPGSAYGPSYAPNGDPNFVLGPGPKWVTAGNATTAVPIKSNVPGFAPGNIATTFPINSYQPSYAPNGDPNFVLGPGPKWVGSRAAAVPVRK